MKRIKIFSLGGTISASIAHQTDYKDYITGAHGSAYWKKTLPEMANLAEIHWEEIAPVIAALL